MIDLERATVSRATWIRALQCAKDIQNSLSFSSFCTEKHKNYDGAFRTI
jgi:hypothetical protein